MKIYSVYDPEFKPYGRVLEGYDTTCLMNAVKTVPLPESGAAPGAPFRVAIVLPRGTNFPMPQIAPKNQEGSWMTARNKWLLAHPDSDEAKHGAHIGLAGENIDLTR